MINYVHPCVWDTPVDPTCDPFQEDKNKMILSRIDDFAECIIKYGIDSCKISPSNNDLIDTLFEHIEENFEKFLPEQIYDV